jgi:glutathione S-transferase
MAPVVLAYWDIRGLAQPIRLLLEHVGAEWEDKYYVCGPAPGYDKSCWFGEKEKLGLPFPNLPYLVDGDVKLTQSGAIIRYLARKYDLLGKTPEEQTRVDLMDGVINDFRSSWTGLCYNPRFEELKGGYLESLPTKLKQISDFLGDRKFFAGDNVTFVDFIVYEMLDQNKLLDPTCLDNFPNLQNFVKNVESLPRVAAYLKSDRIIKDRLNNRMAKFGAGANNN